MKLRFIAYMKDPFSKEHKVFKFKDKSTAYGWFNKVTSLTTGRVTDKRRITFKPEGLVAGCNGTVIGMWKEETQ
ncbi:MAG: hypothetical protein EBT48_06005 [Verrucomicrobia bacterium]|jgi:hypothetical protein|nr:hypothetical protein [Verrucomicrobiota bacterium]